MTVLASLVVGIGPAAAAVTVTGNSADRYFSPNGDGAEDTAPIYYTLSERSRVSIVLTDATGSQVVRHVQADVPTEGSSSFQWDGRGDEATMMADGVYRYRITAEPQTGEIRTFEGRIGIDARPAPAFVRPAADAVVTGVVSVGVSQSGRVLTSGYVYTCSYAAACGGTWVGSLTGTDLDGARSVSWDTGQSTSGDAYLWGYVGFDDAFGQPHGQQLAFRHVTVSRPAQVIAAADRYFTPDGDGQEDVSNTGFRLTTPALVTVRVYDTGGQLVRRVSTDAFEPEGARTFRWDGRDESGATVPDGVYSYSIVAAGAVGAPGTATGRIGVETSGPPVFARPAARAAISGVANVTVSPPAGGVLTGGYLYRCSYEAQCGESWVGSLDTTDLDGSRTVAWNSDLVPSGDQVLWGQVYFNDAFGQQHTYQLAFHHVTVVRAPQITLAADRYFSPDGDGKEDVIDAGFRLSAPASVTVSVRDGAGTLVRRVKTDAPEPEGQRTFRWDGRDDVGAAVPDGVYSYSIVASGALGDPSTAEGRIGVETRGGPAIAQPASGEVVTGVTRVSISAPASGVITSGYLYTCPYAAQCGQTWVGTLGSVGLDGAWSVPWNSGSVTTGEQYLWGYVFFDDAFGQQHTFPIGPHRVTVQRPARATPAADRYFSPDGDGQEDVIDAVYTLTAPASVTVRVRDGEGALVRRVKTGAPEPEGQRSFRWDGRDEDGVKMPDGVYSYSIVAAGAIGEPGTSTGRIGLETGGPPAFRRPAAGEVVSGVAQITVAAPANGTITSGYAYSCNYAANCGASYAGGFGTPDFDGSRSSSWNTASAPVGAQYLWGVVFFDDAFGQSHQYILPSLPVTVSRSVQITSVSVDRYFSPDGDGVEDTHGLSFCINGPADIELAIRAQDAGAVRTIARPALSQGCQTISWDGRAEHDVGEDRHPASRARPRPAPGLGGRPVAQRDVRLRAVRRDDHSGAAVRAQRVRRDHLAERGGYVVDVDRARVRVKRGHGGRRGGGVARRVRLVARLAGVRPGDGEHRGPRDRPGGVAGGGRGAGRGDGQPRRADRDGP